jgi:hypothetical protein
LVGSVYVVSRGLNNVSEALQEAEPKLATVPEPEISQEIRSRNEKLLNQQSRRRRGVRTPEFYLPRT